MLRSVIPLVLPVLLAGAPALAQVATEEDLTIPSQGQSMVATLALPPGDPAPAVLLFHGFTGTRDELPIPGTDEGILSRTARLLAEAGYASLRVDFIGSGESDGDFADTTFEGQIADGLAALEFLRAEPRVAGDDIFIIGWSQGGLVASAVAGRSDAPDAVALWAAVADPMATFTALLGEEFVQAGLATGDTPLTVPLPWGGETALKQGYFEQLSQVDPQAEIASYAGPVFVAQGSADTVVTPDSADLLIAAHEGSEELWVRDMDHAFNALSGTETLDEMVAATIAFFDAHAD
ncbi:alpha/beta hydrolase family protein [Rubellimicrobium roseum]|uniref:Alpha/beta fold hydrolase n=1 Tax=Rubellimicrobium roseum TaxID=687525 RepID=A0A5C4NQI2_9RHOB|nr:alpha/beta fold hydrolase [Rubellimicrobium roseum]TNC74937.1 alpha/beta fold hydrolase [Rubellimicrobium roseum]